LGEYIARIYNETKGRPKYIVARQYDKEHNIAPRHIEIPKSDISTHGSGHD